MFFATLMLLGSALAKPPTLASDFQAQEYRTDKAVVLMVEREDGRVWPLKAPIRFEVSAPVRARAQVEAIEGISTFILRSGGQSWRLKPGTWVEVELEGKTTVTVAARSNTRVNAGALRLQLQALTDRAPAPSVPLTQDRPEPQATAVVPVSPAMEIPAVVRLELGAMPKQIVGPNTALSAKAWLDGCKGSIGVGNQPMMKLEVPAGPGIVLTPLDGAAALVGLVYDGKTLCQKGRRPFTLPGGTHATLYPSRTTEAGSREEPTLAHFAVEDLSVPATPDWAAHNLGALDEAILVIPKSSVSKHRTAEVGYIDLPYDGALPIVASTAECTLLWKGGYGQDNRPTGQREGGQVKQQWQTELEFPTRYVLQASFNLIQSCRVGVLKGPWRGVSEHAEMPEGLAPKERLLASYDPLVRTAWRRDEGSANERRTAETAPAHAWLTVAVAHETLAIGERVLRLQPCITRNESTVLATDGSLHRATCDILTDLDLPIVWPDPPSRLESIDSLDARRLATGHPSLAGALATLQTEVDRFDACQDRVFAKYGDDAASPYDYNLTTYVNGRVSRVENWGGKIEREAFRTCNGARRDRAEETFVQKVVAAEIPVRKATLEVVKKRLGGE